MFRRGSIQDPEITPVYNAASEWEANLAKELLEKAGIRAMTMDREDAGSYLRILGVGSPFGMDIYVRNEDAQRAAQLLEETFSQENALSEEELAEIAEKCGKGQEDQEEREDQDTQENEEPE